MSEETQEERMKRLLAEIHTEHKNSKHLKNTLNQLLKDRGRYYLDHAYTEKLNSVVANAYLRLQIMQEEEANSLWNLIKKGLVTETFKFMIPFILGAVMAIYLPHYIQQ